MIDIELIILLILTYFIEWFCVMIYLIFYDLCLVMVDQCILTFGVLICNSINVFFYVYLSDYECRCVAKNALVSLSCVFFKYTYAKEIKVGKGVFFSYLWRNIIKYLSWCCNYYNAIMFSSLYILLINIYSVYRV